MKSFQKWWSLGGPHHTHYPEVPRGIPAWVNRIVQRCLGRAARGSGPPPSPSRGASVVVLYSRPRMLQKSYQGVERAPRPLPCMARWRIHEACWSALAMVLPSVLSKIHGMANPVTKQGREQDCNVAASSAVIVACHPWNSCKASAVNLRVHVQVALHLGVSLHHSHSHRHSAAIIPIPRPHKYERLVMIQPRSS